MVLPAPPRSRGFHRRHRCDHPSLSRGFNGSLETPNRLTGGYAVRKREPFLVACYLEATETASLARSLTSATLKFEGLLTFIEAATTANSLQTRHANHPPQTRPSPFGISPRWLRRPQVCASLSARRVIFVPVDGRPTSCPVGRLTLVDQMTQISRPLPLSDILCT